MKFEIKKSSVVTLKTLKESNPKATFLFNDTPFMLFENPLDFVVDKTPSKWVVAMNLNAHCLSPFLDCTIVRPASFKLEIEK